MTERISASDLYRIEAEDLRDAVAELVAGKTVHGFADSRDFDVLIEQHRRFSPKAVVGLAARRVLGSVLGPTEFAGGESQAATKLQRGKGNKACSVDAPEVTTSGEGALARSDGFRLRFYRCVTGAQFVPEVRR